MHYVLLVIALAAAGCGDDTTCGPHQLSCSDKTCVDEGSCCSDEQYCGKDMEGRSVCGSMTEVCCQMSGLGYVCPAGWSCASGVSGCSSP